MPRERLEVSPMINLLRTHVLCGRYRDRRPRRGSSVTPDDCKRAARLRQLQIEKPQLPKLLLGPRQDLGPSKIAAWRVLLCARTGAIHFRVRVRTRLHREVVWPTSPNVSAPQVASALMPWDHLHLRLTDGRLLRMPSCPVSLRRALEDRR